MQAVCDADLKIQDVVARWPGATHDSLIFNNSAARARFETGLMSNSFLLGDSGYPSTNYLMTPLENPTTEAEMLYNESQIRTRNTVERCFGVWKRRFPVLSLGVRLKLVTVQDIIVATAVLHNIARLQKESEPLEDPEFPYPEDNTEDLNNFVNATGSNSVRRELINNYFANLHAM